MKKLGVYWNTVYAQFYALKACPVASMNAQEDLLLSGIFGFKKMGTFLRCGGQFEKHDTLLQDSVNQKLLKLADFSPNYLKH